MPSIISDDPVTNDLTATATLIETTTNTQVKSGFRSGEAQVMRANSRVVQFSGLKLNKMGVLKIELSRLNLKTRDCTFLLRFTIGGHVLDSEPFRIVSSFSQLPTEEQTKRTRLPKRSASASLPESPTSTEFQTATLGRLPTNQSSKVSEPISVKAPVQPVSLFTQRKSEEEPSTPIILPSIHNILSYDYQQPLYEMHLNWYQSRPFNKRS